MLLYEDETQEIISAFYEVYNNLGGGFLENVYQDALSIEFKIRNIPFEKESKMNIYYKNQLLDRYYFADFKCYDKLVHSLDVKLNLTIVCPGLIHVKQLEIQDYCLDSHCDKGRKIWGRFGDLKDGKED